MRCSSLPLRAAALRLALAAGPGLAARGVAQGRSVEDARAIEGYRLTMPMLRKVLPTMYAPGTRRCEQRRHRERADAQVPARVRNGSAPGREVRRPGKLIMRPKEI
jgi:hypothetical protein